MTIVETSVWVDILNARATDHTAWVRRNVRKTSLALTELILSESLQGIRDDSVFQASRSFLANFPILDSATEDLAVASADHYRWLRKRGITIRKTIDCITATFCLAQGYDLLHNDRDFDPFEKYLGLKVIHP